MKYYKIKVCKSVFCDFVSTYSAIFGIKLESDFFMDSVCYFDLVNYSKPYEDGALKCRVDYNCDGSKDYYIYFYE